ncbi:hypothetical protein HDV00_004824 [Rhizophlyctis rosea]|nr:hypothetical protein HDV00_004824 [Rhizophlyctis rosea]
MSSVWQCCIQTCRRYAAIIVHTGKSKATYTLPANARSPTCCQRQLLWRSHAAQRAFFHTTRTQHIEGTAPRTESIIAEVSQAPLSAQSGAVKSHNVVPPALEQLRSLIADEDFHPATTWQQLLVVAEDRTARSLLSRSDIRQLRDRLRSARASLLREENVEGWKARLYYLLRLAGHSEWMVAMNLLPFHLHIVDSVEDLDLEGAKGFMDTLRMSGIESDRIVFDLLARALGRGGDVKGLQSVAEWAGNEGFGSDENLTHWSILAHSRAKDFTTSLREFEELKDRTIPRVDIYTTAMHTASIAKNYSLVDTLHTEMRERGVTPTDATYNVLLRSYMEQNRGEEAQSILNELQARGQGSDAETFNALIIGLIHSGRVNDAKDIYDRMVLADVTPNMRTYVLLIRAYAREDLIVNASRFYRLLRSSGMKMGRSEYHAAMYMFSQAGDVEMVRQTVTDMAVAGYAPDAESYRYVIVVEARHGSLEKAAEEYATMKMRGLKPDLITYRELIRACREEGRLEEAVGLFEESRQLNRPLGPGAIYHLVHGLVVRNELEKAEHVLTVSEGLGGHVVYACYELMALGHLRHTKDVSKALSWVKKLVAAGYHIRALLYNHLIAAMVVEKRYEDASKFYEMMRTDGQQPDSFTFQQLLLACHHTGQPVGPILEEMERLGIDWNMYITCVLIAYHAGISRDLNAMWNVWTRWLQHGTGDRSDGSSSADVGSMGDSPVDGRQWKEELEVVGGIMLRKCLTYEEQSKYEEVRAFMEMHGVTVPTKEELEERRLRIQQRTVSGRASAPNPRPKENGPEVRNSAVTSVEVMGKNADHHWGMEKMVKRHSAVAVGEIRSEVVRKKQGPDNVIGEHVLGSMKSSLRSNRSGYRK